MQIEFRLLFESMEELLPFAEVLATFDKFKMNKPGELQTDPVATVPVKPAKEKADKKEKVTAAPDKKEGGTPDVKAAPPAENKPTVAPDVKTVEGWDLETEDGIETARVKCRKKTKALNDAGHQDHTRKAVNKCGNATSITTMEAKYLPDYWEKLEYIEAGQFDKI